MIHILVLTTSVITGKLHHSLYILFSIENHGNNREVLANDTKNRTVTLLIDFEPLETIANLFLVQGRVPVCKKQTKFQIRKYYLLFHYINVYVSSDRE